MKKAINQFIVLRRSCVVFVAFLSIFRYNVMASNSNAQLSFNVTQTKPMYSEWSNIDGKWSDVQLAQEVLGAEGVIYSAKLISAPPNGPRPNEKILIAMIYDLVSAPCQVINKSNHGHYRLVKINLTVSLLPF